jgi:hypothetical protein
MSGFTVLNTARLGADPRCAACGAGALISFNWRYAAGRQSSSDLPQRSSFGPWMPLRQGSLYHCRTCGEAWHLDSKSERMTYVVPARVDLVLAWNREAIGLPEHLAAAIQHIGPTPPDPYGNGIERRVTPCAVETVSGERYEKAMICVQHDAPVQDYLHFKLGSEVAAIEASRFALPLMVREASSRAEEMRMGFSLSLIEMPDMRRFVMNGMTSFMAVDGYEACEARSVDGSYFAENPPPPFVETPEDIVYFVVDGDPGWVLETPGVAPSAARRGWLRRLVGR